MNTGIRWTIHSAVLGFGLALLTMPALASDNAISNTETQDSAPDQQSLENARKANQAAVNDAVNSVIEATRLDLDIRLIGRTSIAVAAGK